ncbi:MAG: TIGR00725 family protein [Mesorhizobium sp.]|nr:TIGR00725 family protein [Mesorhizobium sp.]
MTGLFLSSDERVYSADGREFDPWDWNWSVSQRAGPAQAKLRQVDAVEALRAIGRSGRARKVPIGVIGPREATNEQIQTATELGRELANLGLTVICGGKSGVMQAIAQGVHEAGGLCVGLLPEGDWREANPYIGLPIATGIGKARNVLIAQSSAALVAVGGQYGTLSEIAFGLHFDKPVFGLGDVPDLADIRKATSVTEVCRGLAEFLLRQH